MTTTDWYPLAFEPVYKDYVWGGSRIAAAFDRPGAPARTAESWEVSAHPDGMSVVSNGSLKGRTLAELVRDHGADLLGSRVGAGPFPLLVKLIDAHERLSVQVHPGDDTAARFGGEAKTEMWHVLEADPGARVFAGLRRGVDEASLRAALAAGTAEALLQEVPVRRGDTVFVPGGCVHAIDAGSLILEVQQSSNTTYRLYDWGRMGTDGRPRETHVEQAMRVIRWDAGGGARPAPRPLPAPPSNEVEELLACAHFRAERSRLAAPWTIEGDGGSFQVLFVSDGAVALSWDGQSSLLERGRVVLVPAALRRVVVQPANGPGEVLRITVP